MYTRVQLGVAANQFTMLFEHLVLIRKSIKSTFRQFTHNQAGTIAVKTATVLN